MTADQHNARQAGNDGKHTDEPASVALESMRNEVLRKIGRNLLLFQQMEGMLKFLVGHCKVAGFQSEFPELLAKRAEAVSKRTMGQLIGDYLESSLREADSAAPVPDEVHEGWFSFHFTTGLDAASAEQHGAHLAEIVLERNELVHHLLPRWNPESLKSTSEADAWLDSQRAKALPELEHLRTTVSALQEGRRQLAEHLGSGAFELELLRHSPLVMMLGDIARQLGRDDGFVPLDLAGHLLRLHAAAEFAALKERYGHKTLKSLVLATRLFDIKEEPTPKGGPRVFFRVNPRWSLEISAS